MVKIDLNADLGEGSRADAELMTLVTSVNIACGFHAGDAQTMLESVRNAIKNGVAIGAHPSFPDRENFGRTAMQLPPETIYAQMLYQIGALAAIVRAEGGELKHVKPHGMLYNQAAKEAPLADAIARAVRDFDPALILVGLAGSELVRAGQHYKLVTRQEVFADRGYLADGSLVIVRLNGVNEAVAPTDEEKAQYRRFLASRIGQQDFAAYRKQLEAKADIKKY